jgi:DNA-binding transcriptional ArsR family regulator
MVAVDVAKRRSREDDVRLVRALMHPLRVRILVRLAERDSSPSRLARELGASVGVTSYHVRVLRDLGCVELVGTTPRRGAVEHRYRAVTAPIVDDAMWDRLPVGVRRRLTGSVLHWIARDISGAVARGAFDPPGAHAVRIALSLDEQGWDDLAQLVDRFIQDALRLGAESAARLEDAPPGSVRREHSLLALLHMLRPPASGP